MSAPTSLEAILLGIVLLLCVGLAARWIIRELGITRRKSGGCENCSEGKRSDRLSG